MYHVYDVKLYTMLQLDVKKKKQQQNFFVKTYLKLSQWL